MNIIIRRPSKYEQEKINQFFKYVVTDTFEQNEIMKYKDVMLEEIESKQRSLAEDFDTGGRKKFFLVAVCGSEIIGTAATGIANERIEIISENKYTGMNELGSVLINPNYQKRGVVNKLLAKLFEELINREIEEICFDSGYEIAQKVWTKKFGSPEYFMKDYWGEDAHHMVWKINIKDELEKLR